MPKKTLALVAVCSEAPIQKHVHDWLMAQKLYGLHDRFSFFGSVKNREALMSEIRRALKSRESANVFLISHYGCRAYADRSFANSQLEQEALENDLRNTRDALGAEFSHLPITCLILSTSGRIEPIRS